MILKVKYVLLVLVYYCSFEIFCKNLPKTMKLLPGSVCSVALKVQSAKFSQLAQNNCNLLWQILVALTKLLVGQNWHDPKWLYSDWEYLRSNWNFAVGFEHSQHTNIWWNDVWNIPGLMKWIQTKWLFQNICSQFDLTQTKVPYQTYLRDCMFHLKWLQARPLPTCFDTVLMVQNA